MNLEAPDRVRLLHMIVNGGTLDGVRRRGGKTMELTKSNHVGKRPEFRALVYQAIEGPAR